MRIAEFEGENMGLKEELLEFLDAETGNLKVEQPSDRLTAKVISEFFHVKRNTVSHYLNQLLDEEKSLRLIQGQFIF